MFDWTAIIHSGPNSYRSWLKVKIADIHLPSDFWADCPQVILASEASKQEAINHAMGEAEAIKNKADATAKGLDLVAAALARDHSYGGAAAQLRVAEQYIEVGRFMICRRPGSSRNKKYLAWGHSRDTLATSDIGVTCRT